jgi:hypothetical protein
MGWLIKQRGFLHSSLYLTVFWVDRKKSRLERQLDNVQFEVNYNSREIFKRYDKGAELLTMRQQWCETEIKKEKLKQKTLKLGQRVILKSMKEAEDLQRKCNLKLSTMRFDEEEDSLSRGVEEEEWMAQEDDGFHAQRIKRSTQVINQQDKAGDDEEYSTAWMITQMRYPTITGDMRGRMLTSEDNGGKRRGEKSLLPHQISISMTQHH